MSRKGLNILPLVVVVTGLFLSAPASAQGRAEQGRDRPVILINVDEESVGYIRNTETLAAGKDYTDAIEVLQGLLDRRKQCFVPTDDPRLFVSLTVKVNKVIGRLPPEGGKLYRTLYDPKAGAMFRTAAERFDESALRNIIARYRHTSYGNKALNLLGAIQFDRGEFSQAACCWGRIASTGDETESAAFLARIAMAHHFAGESARATEVMKLLARRHPKAKGAIGGKEQNVAAYVRRILAEPPPFADSIRIEGWPSLAGAPDSLAVMGPCKPVFSARWTTPGGRFTDNPNVKAAVGAYPKDAFGVTASLRNGHVILSSPGIGRSRTMPAVIHPVAVGTTVLYRSAAGVSAHDLLTGRMKWQSPAFPVYRCNQAIVQHICYRSSLSQAVEDRGMWTLTIADGKVFAVGKFMPGSGAINYNRARKYAPKRQFADTSVLAAFSMAGKGRLLWQVGLGEGDTDVVRAGKFMTAPTCDAGRLYVPVKYNNTYRLVCLNAENGRSIWDATIGPIPVMSSQFTGALSCREGWAGPPAVTGGKVFVVTNGGVIAAFEAETGRPLWAYQYDSVVNRRWGRRNQPANSPAYPPNPVIVTKGRIICLPADSKQLLAFRADTGKLDWSADRQGQRDLTAVNSSRLLLSGGGIRIIDAATGKNVWTVRDVSGVHGRPAVTTDAILASGKGKIIRISLKDFSSTGLPVKHPDAILGNLVSAGGKLIAANAAGISAYFPAASTRNNQE